MEESLLEWQRQKKMKKAKRIRIEDRYEFVYIPKYEIIDLFYRYTDGCVFI